MSHGPRRVELTMLEVAALAMMELAPKASGAQLRERAAIAAAITVPESGRNTFAHNDKPPDDSYGLWQINMLGAMGPDRRRKLNIRRNEALWVPATNADAMGMISSGGSDWQPWTTWVDRKHERYLPAARQATAQIGTMTIQQVRDIVQGANKKAVAAGAPNDQGRATDSSGDVNASPGGILEEIPGLGDPLAALISPVTQIAAFFQLITQGSTWMKVLWVLIGLLLLVAAAALIAGDLLLPGGSRRNPPPQQAPTMTETANA